VPQLKWQEDAEGFPPFPQADQWKVLIIVWFLLWGFKGNFQDGFSKCFFIYHVFVFTKVNLTPCPVYKTEINGRGNSLRWPRHTLYPQKLALTSPTSGGRSGGIVCLRTKATDFNFFNLTPWHFRDCSYWKNLLN
jgi:hypothetical protein